jgi:hypothetical protein
MHETQNDRLPKSFHVRHRWQSLQGDLGCIISKN